MFPRRGGASCRRVYELAYCDHLTGLQNRRFLIEEPANVLARGQRFGHYGALLYLDLDNSKLLNDTMEFDSPGQLVGAEVLVRWQRGGHDLVVPITSSDSPRSRASSFLSAYVLEESCRALARWHRDPVLGRLKLAVNVSVHQMRDPAFPAAVAGILGGTGAPAQRLCPELTESVFAENMEQITERMHALSAHGIGFSLDDFGTGYSSLAYLKRFPLATLKIDRSFVRDVGTDPESGPIAEVIIALGRKRKLKLEIVAEGVEHEAQRNFLIHGGCSSMQGYLLSDQDVMHLSKCI